MSVMSRRQLSESAVAVGLAPACGRAADVPGKRLLLRSSWQTENIGDIAHTPGMLALLEKHSPIIAIANDTPAIHLRQPTDTRKGQMWRDVGLEQWIFEIDDSTGKQIADCVVEIGKDLPAARRAAAKARAFAHERMAAMVAEIG